MSGVCITTMLMNSEGGSNIIESIPVPASKPETLEELLPETDKTKKVYADLLGFLILIDITQHFVDDATVIHILVNGEEKVLYYFIRRDDNNNRTYYDIEMDEPILYSKEKENYDILYGYEYINGDIKLISQDNLEDYFKKQTGKLLDKSKVKTICDISIIKRLLDKGNTIYLDITQITKERITTLKSRGKLKPIMQDYSIDDYTTSKIKIR